VLSYLGLSVMERLAVPQVVIIDKKGTIRAQSQPLGSPELQNESNLRKMLTDLAAEGAAKAAAKAAPSSSTAPAPTPAKKAGE